MSLSEGEGHRIAYVYMIAQLMMYMCVSQLTIVNQHLTFNLLKQKWAHRFDEEDEVEE